MGVAIVGESFAAKKPDFITGGQVRHVQLAAEGISLSGLVGEPERIPPRATVVALHGAGMSASYFHGKAHPDLSLITLGVQLGFMVIAVDRPGYGASAATMPNGQPLGEQATTLAAMLSSFARNYQVGDGFFLLAHSYGGKLALTIAAQDSVTDLLGLDISGCGQKYATPEVSNEAAMRTGGGWRRNWGALRCYPPGTFQFSESVVAPVPAREREDALRWPDRFAEVAARVRVPVRFTFAEYESWWRHDASAVADLVAEFTSCPRILIDHVPGSGHNISLGWTARAYHLRALGFLEECLAMEKYVG